MEWELFRVKKDWWAVLTRAWSSWAFWLIILASFLTGLEMAVPVAWEWGWIQSPYYPLFVGVVAMLGLFARLLVQVGITDE